MLHNSVFRNGDVKYRGVRVLLPRKIMGSSEQVLQLITNKTELITPAKRLCTLDGRIIHEVSEIQNGGKYVALEGSKCFQKVSYCATEEKNVALLKSTHICQCCYRCYCKCMPEPRTVARLRHRTEQLVTSDIDALVRGAPMKDSVHQHVSPKRKKSIRPMAGRKNKEGREKAIKDQRLREVCENYSCNWYSVKPEWGGRKGGGLSAPTFLICSIIEMLLYTAFILCITPNLAPQIFDDFTAPLPWSIITTTCAETVVVHLLIIGFCLWRQSYSCPGG